MNLFEEGRRAREERVFSVENDKKSKESCDDCVIELCMQLGMHLNVVRIFP